MNRFMIGIDFFSKIDFHSLLRELLTKKTKLGDSIIILHEKLFIN